jgi:hypothetical protein
MTALSEKSSRLVEGSTGLVIDGVFASEVWDSSGEVLDIAGCDISEMEEGRGLANYEHRNDESTGATSQDIVGRIIYARKIFNESDCEDERQKMFWKKVKVPFIYGMVRLYDGAGHLSAQGLAAQVRDAVKNKEQILVRFSIDGSTLERDGNHLKRTIARRVALTIKPCNKTCDSDLVVDPNAPEGYEKKPKKPLVELVKKEHPLYGRLGSSGEIEQDAPEQQALWKALKASKEAKPAAKKSVLPKAPKPPAQWESEDGVVIPRAGTPDRRRWDTAYEKALKQHFGGGKPIQINVDEAQSLNPVRNYDRYAMYVQMAQHDRLPPAVVRRSGSGWEIVDGNHRHFAAKKAGLKTMDAIDITESKARKSEQETGMKKAMDAGMATGSPSSLVGGAALQREELAKKLVKLAQDYHESKGSMRDFLKSQLPEVSDHYLDHFTDLATDIRARLRKTEPLAKARKKAEGAGAEAAAPVSEPAPAPKAAAAKAPRAPKKPAFTVRGEGVKASGLSGPQMVFNEHTGQLKTKNGHFSLYNPDADGDSGEKFRQVWNSPEVRRQHDYAVGNWVKLNQALKQGRLPEAVLATSVAFSQLSPNTPVPVHEMMYSIDSNTILYPVGQEPKKIKDFRKGDLILGVDSLGNVIETEVLALHDHGDLMGYEITFENGYSITTSKDHKFLTPAGMMSIVDVVRFGVEVVCGKEAEDRWLASEMRSGVSDGGSVQGPSSRLCAVQGDAPASTRRLCSRLASKKSGSRGPAAGEGDGRECGVATIESGSSGSGSQTMAPGESGGMGAASSLVLSGDAGVATGSSGDDFEVSSAACCRCCSVSGGAPRTLHGDSEGAGGVAGQAREPLSDGGVASVFWYADMAGRSDPLSYGRAQTGGLSVSRSQDLGGSGRSAPLLPDHGDTGVAGSFGQDAAARRDVEGRGSATRQCDVDSTFHGVLQDLQEQGDEGPLVGSAESDTPVALSGGLVLRRVVRVRTVGISRMYDLEVAHPKHNFLLPCGIVTSNSYLLDTFKEKGMDIRDARFGSPEVKQDWMSRDQPHAWPQSSRDYFTQQIGDLVTNQRDSTKTGRLAGERTSFMLAHNKFANMARYADAHQHMKDLVSRHGVDGRSAVAELMGNKGKAELWEATRKRALDKGKPDPGPFQGLHIPGLAPKTARFAYAMLGAGNSFVPDTHFSRHLFGLDKDKDKQSIHHIRDDILWNHKNSDLLSAMDRWYYRNHPAVKLMLEHPEFGSYFKDNPEQAVFPAFWGHWLSIAPHERLMEHKRANVAHNQAASHRPLFDEVQRLLQDPKESQQTVPARATPLPESPAPQSNLRFGFKKSEESGPLIDPRLAAALVRHWINHHGEEEASFRYYSQLLPLLMHGSENEDPILKAEKLSVEVRNAAARLKKANGNPTEAAPTRGEDPADSSRHSLGLALEKDLVERNTKHIAPVKVSAADGSDRINNTPEQKALIDGVDLSRNLKAKPVHATESLTSPTQMWIPHPDDKRLVLVKHGHEWSYPHMGARETAYHNLARDVFGLGEYVPLTAMANHPGGWEMSMQEMVKNPEHHNSGSGAHLKTLMRLGDAGELHKLAAMNYILGNDDRHGNNYLFSRGDDGKLSLKLIDHGHTFRNTAEEGKQSLEAQLDQKPGPGLRSRELRKPHYLKVYEFEKARPAADFKGKVGGRVMMTPKSSMIHPDAVEWLRNLDGAKLKSKMEDMGLGDRAIEGVMRDFHALRNSWTKPGATTETPTQWSDRDLFEGKDFAPAGQELHSDEPEDWQRSDWSGMKSASTSGPTRKLKKADDEDAHDDEECSECGTDHVHIGAYIVEHCHHDEGSHLCIYDEKTGEKIAETEISKDLDDALDKADKPFHGYNKNRHSRSGGLSDSYREKVNREEGSNLKRPVTGKVEPGSKAAKRRKSFCARMSGVKGPTSKDGKLTPKGAALKRWKCSKSALEKSAGEGLATLSKAELLSVLESLGVASQTTVDILRLKDKV